MKTKQHNIENHFGPKLPPVNLLIMAHWGDVLNYREHIAMKDQLTKMQKEHAQYKAALEDFRDYSPYTGTRDRAKEALDMSKPFKPSSPMKK